MSKLIKVWSTFLVAIAALPLIAEKSCHVEAIQFHGWSAQQLSNASVKLTIVPQLGGRLMQVEFAGHPYLFVNPQYEGKYISPEQAVGNWINYGGDKIWPMPEGNRDEQHWVLESSALDDAPYAFKVVRQDSECTVELDGPVDEKTGLQFSRQISIGSKSPAIHFHAMMRNATAHTMQWSVQSVSQYSLASASDASQFNRNFWAYTSVRDDSSYLNGFHVRSGLVDDPSFSVRDGLFRLHWMYFSNEVWIDSPGGWLAIADGEGGFGMIERVRYDANATYPGKATVIFYKNGPSVDFDAEGKPQLTGVGYQNIPYYMEAEINSPLVILDPGSTYAFDTQWFPLRTGAGVQRVTEAGTTNDRLRAAAGENAIHIKGTFGVVVSGHLQLRIFNRHGREAERITLDAASPQQEVHLDQNISVEFTVARVSLHLLDDDGNDWGALDEAEVGNNP
jgi:hypothetical protein